MSIKTLYFKSFHQLHTTPIYIVVHYSSTISAVNVVMCWWICRKSNLVSCCHRWDWSVVVSLPPLIPLVPLVPFRSVVGDNHVATISQSDIRYTYALHLLSHVVPQFSRISLLLFIAFRGISRIAVERRWDDVTANCNEVLLQRCVSLLFDLQLFSWVRSIVGVSCLVAFTLLLEMFNCVYSVVGVV